MYTVILGQIENDEGVFTEHVHALNPAHAVEVAMTNLYENEFYELYDSYEDFKAAPYSVFGVFHGWQINLV